MSRRFAAASAPLTVMLPEVARGGSADFQRAFGERTGALLDRHRHSQFPGGRRFARGAKSQNAFGCASQTRARFRFARAIHGAPRALRARDCWRRRRCSSQLLGLEQAHRPDAALRALIALFRSRLPMLV